MIFRLALLCGCIALSYSCSCMGTYFPGAFCNVQILFRGKVISQRLDPEPEDPNNPIELQWSYRYYTVEIHKVYRMPASMQGGNQNTIELRTSAAGNLCGAYFPMNTERVFAASEYNGVVSTSLCSANADWASLSPDTQSLLEDGELDDYCEDNPNASDPGKVVSVMEPPPQEASLYVEPLPVLVPDEPMPLE